MLLATKCPHCKTTFKVANDQLKLQAGLVRCGICQQVFDGIEHLVGANDANHEANQPEMAATTNSAEAHDAFTPSAGQPSFSLASDSDSNTEQINPEPASAGNSDLEFELDPIGSESVPANLTPQTQVELQSEMLDKTVAMDFSELDSEAGEENIQSYSEEEIEAEAHMLLDAESAATEGSELEVDVDDLEFDLLALDESTKSIESTELAEPAIPLQDTELQATVNVPSSAEPQDELPTSADDAFDAGNIEHLSFIREANAKKRITWLLSIGTLALLLLLVGQATYVFRNIVVATYPSAKGTLDTLCQLAHCQIQLPAQLSELSYEADELHTLTHENTFEFGLLLHNHSAVTQAWPHIELTLKNLQKQVVLRRVFTPAEYLTNKGDIATGFPPNQEQSVKLYFEVNNLKASDYVVAIFYP